MEHKIFKKEEEDRIIFYYGECSHFDCFDITRPNCTKRYIEVEYVFDKEYRTCFLAFCNETFNLELHNRIMTNNFYPSYRYQATALIEEIIFKIGIAKDTDSYYNNGNRSPLNQKVSYTVCNRPYISASLSFKETIDVLSSHSNPHLKNEFKNHIIKINDYLQKYMKYKYQWKNAQRIVSNINKNWGGLYQTDIDNLTEFYINIISKIE